MAKQTLASGLLVIASVILLAHSGGLEWLAVLVPSSLLAAFAGMRFARSGAGFTEDGKKGRLGLQR